MPAPTAYVSQPQISINGQGNDSLNTNVLSLFVEETIEGLFRCEACFNNFGGKSGGGSDYLYFGRDVLDFGKEITIQLGPGDQAVEVFKGRITGLEAEYPEQGGSQILVLAEDRLQDLRMTRRTRSFEDVSDQDVIEQIANEHSLTPEMNLDGPTYKVLTQVNSSDLAFIRERVRSVNAELWVQGTTLYARARTDRDAGTIDLSYGVNLLSFTVLADLAQQCTELGVAGWDVEGKDGIDETADESAISAELNGDTSGASILQQALASRQERIVHTVPFTVEEARSIAQARYRERARRFVTGTGLADGNPNIRVGAILNLSRLGGLFNGKYYVVRARHSYDRSLGYRTEFDVERPGLGQAQQ
jgi:phage protein D